MPPKGKKAAPRAKKRVDKAQNSRIKDLEQFVYKTIENKQINFNSNVAVSTLGYSNTVGLVPSIATGPDDGINPLDTARIGNDVTLMRTAVNMCFEMSDPITGDATNRFRAILVESLDGNQALALSDVLQYSSYAIYGNQVFVSPYTTKALTNRNYKILMDRVIDMNQLTKYNYDIKFVKNWKGGKVLNFAGKGAGLPTNYNISFLLISDSLVPSHPSCNWSVRSTYKDA